MARPDDPAWEWTAVLKPDMITAASAGFLKAGADILVAFTDRLNAISARDVVGHQDIEPAAADRITRIIIESVRRAAAGQPRPIAVLAGIGPVEPLLMLDEITADALRKCYAAQARQCVRAGADGLLCRSFTELDALRCAIEGIQSECALPIIGSMTFDAGPDAIDTVTGVSVPQAHQMLASLDAAMVGVDRGEFPDGAAAIVSLMRQSGDLPIYVEVNAGRMEIVDQRIIFPESAETYGERFAQLADAGGRVIAGGLGAGSRHIAQWHRVRERLERRARRPRQGGGE